MYNKKNISFANRLSSKSKVTTNITDIMRNNKRVGQNLSLI